MKILLATGNGGKLRELQNFFADLDCEFLSLKNFPKIAAPPENEKTFEKNAAQKAKFFAEKFGFPTIAEDSGLILRALPRKFGVRTRREIAAATDEIWLEKFLKMLENECDRRADFFSAIAFFWPKKNLKKIFCEKCSGQILKKIGAKIERGIPVSSVFLPVGEKKIFAAMSKNEKNKISHRGRAARKMADFLQKIL